MNAPFGLHRRLPKNWESVAIKDVTSDWRGGAPFEPEDFTEQGFPVLHKGAIQKGGQIAIDPKKKTFTTESFVQSHQKSVIDQSYVAVTLRDLVPSGPSIGLVADLARFPSQKYILAQGAYGFHIDRGRLHPTYLVWLSNYEPFRLYMKRYAVGSTQIHVRTPVFQDLEIPLPPIAQQRRIADILDRADAIRRKRQEAIRMTEELLRSAFLEMFGDPVTNPKGWEVVKLDAVTESKLGKMFWKESLTGLNPVPYLGNTHVRWRSFDLSELPTMDFSESELQKLDLRDGDLVVCEGGEVGRCAIWRNQLKEISFQKALHRVRCDETKVVPEYLQEYFFLMAKHGGLSSSTSSATIAHLTGVKLKQLPLPLPPIEQQRLFQKVYATYEHSNQKYHNALAGQENLFNSLLQTAFRGEL